MSMRQLITLLYVIVGLDLFSISESASPLFKEPEGAACACPGQNLAFRCVVIGAGSTLWSGTAFSCSNSNNEIQLRHTQFNTLAGAVGSCNSGAIEARSDGVMNDCYSSQLIVSVSTSLNNKTIQCTHDSDMGLTLIGSTTLNFAYASDYLPELSGFQVLSVNMTEITISWTEVNSLCSESIGYNVTSNCSSVRCTTRRNGATCSNLPIATILLCSFSIYSEICGQMETVAVNNVITVTLRRPRVDIIPVYSPGSSSTLTKVIITIYPEPFLSIAGDGPSPVVGYSFSYSNENMNIAACQESEDECQRSIDITCPPSAEIDVTLSASSRLGRGPATDPMTIGCTNEFVHVEYDSATSTITCNFLDERDLSIKSCFFQQCDQILASSPGQNSTVEAPNTIPLSVATGDSDCFLVTASSNSFRVTVEVRTSVGTGNANTRAAIGISVVVVIGVIMVFIITIMVVIVRRRIVMVKHKRIPFTESLPLTASDHDAWKEIKQNGEFRRTQAPEADKIVERFQLQEVPVDDIKLIDVYKDYELKELTKEVNSELKICVGRSFCLFEGELEDIPEQRNITFLHEIIGKLFFASNISTIKQNRNFSDKMTSLRKLFKGYKVFVENLESDEKHLKEPTCVLYKVQKTQCNTEGAANPRNAIAGGATNGNTATKGNTGGATKDATKSNTENATDITPI